MTVRIDGSPSAQSYTAENMVITAGGPASDVARLQLVLLDQQEDAANTSRTTNRNSAKQMRKAQVSEMRHAADMQLAAGLTRAASSMVGAAIEFGSASRADAASDLRAQAGVHSANATELGSTPASVSEQRTANFQNGAAGAADGDAKRLQTGGKALEAGGQALGAVFDHAAARANARATEFGSLAEGFQSDAEAAGELAGQTARRADRMMEALAQIANARAEAVRNAVA